MIYDNKNNKEDKYYNRYYEINNLEINYKTNFLYNIVKYKVKFLLLNIKLNSLIYNL